MRRKEREEGVQDGLQQGKREIARSLLAKGLDHAFVAETTGLTIEELAQL
jgi:predicted transposase/invertase (TIGR01784 family)